MFLGDFEFSFGPFSESCDFLFLLDDQEEDLLSGVRVIYSFLFQLLWLVSE